VVDPQPPAAIARFHDPCHAAWADPGIDDEFQADCDLLLRVCRTDRPRATGWGLDADTVRFFTTQWVPDTGRWGDPVSARCTRPTCPVCHRR